MDCPSTSRSHVILKSPSRTSASGQPVAKRRLESGNISSLPSSDPLPLHTSDSVQKVVCYTHILTLKLTSSKSQEYTNRNLSSASSDEIDDAIRLRPQLTRDRIDCSEESIPLHVTPPTTPFLTLDPYTFRFVMRIAAKATKGRGRRYWARGQASSSNPVTHKFRSKAKSKWSGDGEQTANGLTVRALATHNALNFENLNLSDGEQSERNTVNTFASIWSQCTNPDFEKFLNTWSASSDLQKEMLAILSSATQTIREKSGQQGTTEYFIVLVTMLEEVDSGSKVAAITELLRIIIAKISVAVLRHGFDQFSRIFADALSRYTSSSNLLLIRGLIHCMGILLRSLDSQSWAQSGNAKLLHMLLPFAIHADANVRKSTRRTLTGLITANRNDRSKRVATLICSHCIARMTKSRSVNENVARIIQTMMVLKLCVCEVETADLKKLIETLLSFMALENPDLTICALEIIALVYNSRSGALTNQIANQTFNALFQFMPPVSEPDVVPIWIRTNKDIVSFWNDDKKRLSDGACRLVRAIVTFFTTDVSELQQKLAFNLIAILRLVAEADIDLDSISSISSSIDSTLEFKYQDSWSTALTVIAAKFEVLSSKYTALCIETLKSLKTLRQSPNFTLEVELDSAVGAAVSNLGPEIVMQVIGLDMSATGIKFSWLLPVIKRHIRSGSLSFFASTFVPLAQKAKILSMKAAVTDEMSGKHLEVMYHQMWSLLPGFCSNPNDVETFASLAPILGRMLREDATVRSYIISSLRYLVKFVEANPQSIEHVAKYSKNFFPILLNIYTTEFSSTSKDNLLPVFETIESFLRIASPQKIQELSTKTLERYSHEDDLCSKLAYLDLVRAYIPYLCLSDLDNIFAQVVEPLLSDKNCRLQKKAFRLIEEVSRSSSEDCKALVQSQLQSVLLSLMRGLEQSAASAKSACLNALRNIIVQFFVVVAAEIDVILSRLVPLIFQTLQIKSSRTRQASLELMKTLVSLSLQNQMSVALVHSVSQYLTSAATADKAVLCVTCILPQLLQSLSLTDLLPLFDMIYRPATTKSLTRAVIEFTKLCVKELPDPQSLLVMEKAMGWLSRLKPVQRSKCRVPIRDMVTRFIRKFGYDLVASKMPEDLSKVLRNIRKKSAAKKVTEPIDTMETMSRASKRSRRTLDTIIHESSDESDDDEPVRHKNSRTQLREDPDDFDLLQSASLRTEKKKINEDKEKEDPLIQINAEGKIVVKETTRKRKLDHDQEDDDDGEENETKTQARSALGSSVKSYRSGGRGIHRPLDKTEAASGKEFKSKKGKSDEKRKGVAVDPYAYVPLNRSALNKRRKVSIRGSFKQLVSRKSRKE